MKDIFLLVHRDKNLINLDVVLIMIPMALAVQKSVPKILQHLAAEVLWLMMAADINARAVTPARVIMIAAELGSIVQETLVTLIQHVAVSLAKATISQTNVTIRVTAKAFTETAIALLTALLLVLKAVSATARLKPEKAGLTRPVRPVREKRFIITVQNLVRADIQPLWIPATPQAVIVYQLRVKAATMSAENAPILLVLTGMILLSPLVVLPMVMNWKPMVFPED